MTLYGAASTRRSPSPTSTTAHRDVLRPWVSPMPRKRTPLHMNMRPEDWANLGLLVELLSRTSVIPYNRTEAVRLALREAVERRKGEVSYRVAECLGCGVPLPVQSTGRPRERCAECSRLHASVNASAGTTIEPETNAARLERMREYGREYRQRPEVKARRLEYNREYEQRPEVKARRRAYRAQRNAAV